MNRVRFPTGARKERRWHPVPKLPPMPPVQVSGLTLACPLPPPIKGESDITKPYIKKFGIPLASKRVFIQTRQQVDGWQAFPAQTNVLVAGHQWSLHSTVAGE